MIRSLLAASALSAACAVPAFAQIASEQSAERRAENYLAAGVAFAPDYPGSDDYRALPFGAFRSDVAGRTVRTEGPGLAAALVEGERLELGVYGRWYSGRDDDIEDAVVSALPEIDATIAVGGYARLILAEALIGPFDQLSVTGRAGVDALGTVDGAIWNASIDYGAVLSPRVIAALSLGVSGFSDDYFEQHFGVDAAGAAASGLPEFAAEGGVRDVGATAFVDYRLAGPWSVSGVVGWSRLVGDAADSPLVAIRGTEDQVFAGLALGRRF